MTSEYIYLDYAATTPPDPEVREAMIPFLSSYFGNPSSIHLQGQIARKAVETARFRIASLIGADPEEIVFTSGGTEADVLAVSGVLFANEGKKRHVVTSAIEHPAVLQCLEFWEKRGVSVTKLKPNHSFIIEPEAVREAIKPETVLVSSMLVNNVTGAVQPVREIAQIAHEHGALVHTDAVQALAKLPFDVRDLGVDLLSISSHKIYGPKGVGALYVRSGLALPSPGCGGGQERGRRGGTENVPGIVGFGEAARLAQVELEIRTERARMLREQILKDLREQAGPLRVNGDLELSVPHIINLCLVGVDTFKLVSQLSEKGLFLSVGSACTSGKVTPSRVLKAGGLSDFAALSSFRISTGKDTTIEQVRRAARLIAEEAKQLRSPEKMEQLGVCDENCSCFFDGDRA